MRNPAYDSYNLDVNNLEPTTSEEYWSLLNREAYKTGLFKLMDFIVSKKIPMDIIGEVQIGCMHFTDLLREYLDLMEIDAWLVGSDENFGIHKSSHQLEFLDDPEALWSSNLVFIVDCLPYMEKWKDKLHRLWEELDDGCRVILFDTRTPTLYRDLIGKFPDAVLEYSAIVEDEPALSKPSTRNLKVRMFRKRLKSPHTEE